MSRIDVVHARAGKGATDGDWEKPVHTHHSLAAEQEVDGGCLPFEKRKGKSIQSGKRRWTIRCER